MPFDPYTLTAEYRLNALPFVFNKHGIVFSKTEAALLVGGRGRLDKLIAEGKIRVDKPTAKQNGKWFCNGGDVIRNVKI